MLSPPIAEKKERLIAGYTLECEKFGCKSSGENKRPFPKWSSK